ncbi:MAG: lysophospholipase [Bacteroidota bacterium]
MKTDTFMLTADDFTHIFVHSWIPEQPNEIKGIVQIAHGMAEHALRYHDFATYLVLQGYMVFANDHRGHGKTAGNERNLGILANTNSWQAVLGDMLMLNRHIHRLFPDKNIILLGHSMGSFYARAYLQIYPETISGIILSGTAWQAPLLLSTGLAVAKIQCLLKGDDNPSRMLTLLAFAAFNKKIKPIKTPFDWISRDEAICRNYTQDALCGFVCSSSFFRELFRLMKFVHRDDLYGQLNRNFPILILSGTMDPVGNYGQGPKQMLRFLDKKGFMNMEIKLYPQGRHEMLNEMNRAEVWDDLREWLGRKVRSNNR